MQLLLKAEKYKWIPQRQDSPTLKEIPAASEKNIQFGSRRRTQASALIIFNILLDLDLVQ